MQEAPEDRKAHLSKTTHTTLPSYFNTGSQAGASNFKVFDLA